MKATAYQALLARAEVSAGEPAAGSVDFDMTEAATTGVACREDR
jgi:hypothetical protein